MKKKKLESLKEYKIICFTSKFTGGCNSPTGSGSKVFFGVNCCFKSDTDTYDDKTGDYLSTEYHDSDCSWDTFFGGTLCAPCVPDYANNA